MNTILLQDHLIILTKPLYENTFITRNSNNMHSHFL